MVSTIDITKPVQGSPTTDSVRTNFQRAYNEITALQNLSNSYLPIVGGIVDNLTINHEFYIGNPVGSYVWASTDFNAMPTIQLNSSPTDSGSLIVISKGDKRRWIIQSGTIGGNDETGTGNVGSNLTINSYDDDGLNLGNILTINRSTGFSSFKKSVYFESDIRVGTSTSQKAIKMVGAAGQGRPIQWITGDADLASGMRWQIGLTSTAESGSNVGSDLVIQRFSDVGVALTPHAFTLNRATGLLTLSCGLSLAATVASSVTDLSKHIQILTGYGINYTSGRLNLVGGSNNVAIVIGGVDRMLVSGVAARFGDGASAMALQLNGASATSRSIAFLTGGLSRWSLITPTAGAESTGNVGTDLALYRFDDAGTFIGAIFTVTRSTGITVFNNDLTTNGWLTAGTNTVSGAVIINGPATSGRQNRFQTAGLDRWRLGLTTAVESGSNAGSDWILQRYADAGTLIGTAFTISRASGLMTLSGNMIATAFLAGSASGPTWSTGTGAPSGTAPIGSMYSRTDGTVGATLYVRSTGSVWTPIAGV